MALANVRLTGGDALPPAPAGMGEVEWQRELAAGTIEPVLNYYTDFLSYDDPDNVA